MQKWDIYNLLLYVDKVYDSYTGNLDHISVTCEQEGISTQTDHCRIANSILPSDVNYNNYKILERWGYVKVGYSGKTITSMTITDGGRFLIMEYNTLQNYKLAKLSILLGIAGIVLSIVGIIISIKAG